MMGINECTCWYCGKVLKMKLRPSLGVLHMLPKYIGKMGPICLRCAKMLKCVKESRVR